MSMWAFRAFSDPWFLFCFQFFSSDDLNKDPEMSQRPDFQTQLHVGLSLPIFWVFSSDLCAIRCVKKSELHQ